jgi:hypothetical protein
MIYVNGVRLWLQVSRQRSIKSVYTLSLCLIEQQSKAINRNVHQIAGSCGQADAKRKERIHGICVVKQLRNRDAREDYWIRPAWRSLVGSVKRCTGRRRQRLRVRLQRLGPALRCVLFAFVCVQRWREQLDRKAAAAVWVKKGKGRGTSDSGLDIHG